MLEKPVPAVRLVILAVPGAVEAPTLARLKSTTLLAVIDDTATGTAVAPFAVNCPERPTTTLLNWASCVAWVNVELALESDMSYFCAVKRIWMNERLAVISVSK